MEEENNGRVIKFRSWNPKDKMMDQWESMRLITFKWFDEHDDVLLQYTGLLDKNGREIYEGDLVTFEAHRDGKEYYTATEAVQFDLGQFHIHGTALRDYHNIEVIGDVYQNPELLK